MCIFLYLLLKLSPGGHCHLNVSVHVRYGFKKIGYEYG